MGAINRIPEGLLSLLASKTQGRNPFELLESVRPSLDLLWAYQTDMASSLVTGTGAASNDFVAITVPAAEAWLIHAARAELTTAATTAGQRYSFELRINGAPLAGFPGFVSGSAVASSGLVPFVSTTTAAGDPAIQNEVAKFFEKPFLLRGGYSLECRINHYEGAATANLGLEVIYTPLLI